MYEIYIQLVFYKSERFVCLNDGIFLIVLKLKNEMFCKLRNVNNTNGIM